MLSQNTQQSLFNATMAKPGVMNVSNTMSRQNNARQVNAVKPTMTVKQNFGGAKQVFAVTS